LLVENEENAFQIDIDFMKGRNERMFPMELSKVLDFKKRERNISIQDGTDTLINKSSPIS